VGGAHGLHRKKKGRKRGAWARRATILKGHNSGERRGGGSRAGAPRSERRGLARSVGGCRVAPADREPRSVGTGGQRGAVTSRDRCEIGQR
jgi:hypothetical protein